MTASQTTPPVCPDCGERHWCLCSISVAPSPFPAASVGVKRRAGTGSDCAFSCPDCQMERLLEDLRRFPGTASVEDNTLAALRILDARVTRLERQSEETP